MEALAESKLKPCPCGVTPTKLCVVPNDFDGGKWARVGGNCCGEWEIEFRTSYHKVGSTACLKLAEEAWNSASRG